MAASRKKQPRPIDEADIEESKVLQGYASMIDNGIRDNFYKHGIDSAIMWLMDEAYCEDCPADLETLCNDFEDHAKPDEVRAALKRLCKGAHLVQTHRDGRLEYAPPRPN
jgi:hypothetical protein